MNQTARLILIFQNGISRCWTSHSRCERIIEGENSNKFRLIFVIRFPERLKSDGGNKDEADCAINRP